MGLLKKLYNNFEECACALLVATMIVLLTLQVLIRATIGSSLAWSEELSRYSFLWAVYIGAALAVKKNAHVRITAQFLWMSTRSRLLFRILADVVWVGFALYFAWTGLNDVMEGIAYPEISPTMGIVKAYVEAIIPFSFMLMVWRIVEQYIHKIRSNSLQYLVCHEGEL